jgi:2-phosphosulfolactate phosphatase
VNANNPAMRQEGFAICCEWGARGVEMLAPTCDVVVIIDVLSFSTCVEIATSRGAMVFPYAWRDTRAAEFARSKRALLAGENALGLSLRPASLTEIDRGCRLVLPSPNGSQLSTATGEVPTLAGCLRNARAVARHAAQLGDRILVVPAGERWPDGSLRPSLEDHCGAGAIIHHLPAGLLRSPEAQAAAALFEQLEPGLPESLRECSSAREKRDRDQERDFELAVELDVSTCVPALRHGAYIGASSTAPAPSSELR